MKTSFLCAALGSCALMLTSCETPPTVVTQTTTTTETTEVSQGERTIVPSSTVVYPSTVRTTTYRPVTHVRTTTYD